MALSVAGMRSKNISDFIGMHRLQSEFTKLVSQPFPACAFAKGRCCDARQLHLPLRELWFLCAKPGEGGANFGKLAEVCHLVLHSRKRVRYVRLRSGHGAWSLVSGPWSLVVRRWLLAFNRQLSEAASHTRFSPLPCHSRSQRPKGQRPRTKDQGPTTNFYLTTYDLPGRLSTPTSGAA